MLGLLSDQHFHGLEYGSLPMSPHDPLPSKKLAADNTEIFLFVVLLPPPTSSSISVSVSVACSSELSETRSHGIEVE